MRAERETVAAQRAAEGLRVAAQIRSDAARDARITIADAQSDAAAIEAQSREKAAQIYAASYARDPALYMLLRSLDTINTIVGPRTRLILRTDAAPFNVLVQGPPIDFTAKAPPPAPPAASPSKGDKLDDGAAAVMGLLDPRHGTGSP
jgi:membrane protease subunit HflC